MIYIYIIYIYIYIYICMHIFPLQKKMSAVYDPKTLLQM